MYWRMKSDGSMKQSKRHKYEEHYLKLEGRVVQLGFTQLFELLFHFICFGPTAQT